MAFTIDCTKQRGQPADLAQLEERYDRKGSETYIGSSPVIGMSKGLHSSLCQNSPLPLDFIFIGVSA
jgi:hypothetical protein